MLLARRKQGGVGGAGGGGWGRRENWHKARFEFALVKLMQLYPTKRLRGEPSAGARGEVLQPRTTPGLPKIASAGYTPKIPRNLNIQIIFFPTQLKENNNRHNYVFPK